jgi:branched-chain amino acid transport system substrate-binding protein
MPYSQADQAPDVLPAERFDRRRLLRRAATAGVALGLAPWIATGRARAATRTIKIGYVAPLSGALAPYGAVDTFTVAQMWNLLGNGLRVGNDTFPVEILERDSQSSPDRAAGVAKSLIADGHIDLMLVGDTSDGTINPVADACEAKGVPCISSLAPWQEYFFGRNGDPKKGFKWTYHFFWGLEDVAAVFLDMWPQVATNKVVGGLYPNDTDGNAWGDKKLGLPSPLGKAGYTVIDPGRYPNRTVDFDAQIAAYKKAKVQLLTGVPLAPDFATFWKQAWQQGFHPKIATVGKALLFPAAVEALGKHGAGLSSELWWSPYHPYRSSLTGQSAAALAAAWTKATKKQWTQPVGFAHGLFEVAADVLRRTKNIDDKAAIVDAIKATNLDTVVGHISWKNGPVPNVAKTRLAGAQWRRGRKYPYELVVVSSKRVPGLKRQGKLEPIPYG